MYIRRRHCPAFTLVELLVVIGIIALLISILMPALTRARNAANAAKCLSNLRQLGMAMVMYTNENNGFYPFSAGVDKGASAEDWLHWETSRDPRNSALARYITGFRLELFRCPGDEPFVRPRVLSRGPYNYSYTMNYRFSSYNSWRIKYSVIRNPSEKIVLVEEQAETLDDGNWHPNYPPLPNYLSGRHDTSQTNPNKARGNIAFADGHAQYIAREWTFDQAHWDPTQ